jgi:hypothetical protein
VGRRGAQRIKTDKGVVNAATAIAGETGPESHIEHVFLAARQELKRFQQKGLGYSKASETTRAVALALNRRVGI